MQGLSDDIVERTRTREVTGVFHSRKALFAAAVKDGWIALEGAVEWQYQKTTAENAVRKVKGVKGVTNVIMVKPKVEPSDLKRKIQEAFKRNAEVDATRITVETNGSEVVLKGAVRSWIECDEAERVAS